MRLWVCAKIGLPTLLTHARTHTLTAYQLPTRLSVVMISGRCLITLAALPPLGTWQCVWHHRRLLSLSLMSQAGRQKHGNTTYSFAYRGAVGCCSG